jgi:trehalose 6-phosphate synthase
LARLVIVSNRVAMPRDTPSRAGGLAVALRDAMTDRGGLWFGWSGEVAEKTAAHPDIEVAGKITYATMELGREDYETFYLGYANGALWPICHYRPGFIDARRHEFEGYLRVNETFAKQLAACSPTISSGCMITIYPMAPICANGESAIPSVLPAHSLSRARTLHDTAGSR